MDREGPDRLDGLSPSIRSYCRISTVEKVTGGREGRGGGLWGTDVVEHTDSRRKVPLDLLRPRSSVDAVLIDAVMEFRLLIVSSIMVVGREECIVCYSG